MGSLPVQIAAKFEFIFSAMALTEIKIPYRTILMSVWYALQEQVWDQINRKPIGTFLQEILEVDMLEVLEDIPSGLAPVYDRMMKAHPAASADYPSVVFSPFRWRFSHMATSSTGDPHCSRSARRSSKSGNFGKNHQHAWLVSYYSRQLCLCRTLICEGLSRCKYIRRYISCRTWADPLWYVLIISQSLNALS